MGGWRSKHLSGRLVLGKGPRYPLHWLGGHDSWFERVWRRENLLPPPDFEPQPCGPQQFTIPSTLSRLSSFSSGPKYRLSMKLLWTARWNKPSGVSSQQYTNSAHHPYKILETVIILRPIPYFLRPAAFNPLNPELNPICYLLALLGAQHFLHVSRIRVKLLTFRVLMSYIYIYIYIYIWH